MIETIRSHDGLLMIRYDLDDPSRSAVQVACEGEEIRFKRPETKPLTEGATQKPRYVTVVLGEEESGLRRCVNVVVEGNYGQLLAYMSLFSNKPVEDYLGILMGQGLIDVV
jgi:hypothetical protein